MPNALILEENPEGPDRRDLPDTYLLEDARGAIETEENGRIRSHSLANLRRMQAGDGLSITEFSS